MEGMLDGVLGDMGMPPFPLTTNTEAAHQLGGSLENGLRSLDDHVLSNVRTTLTFGAVIVGTRVADLKQSATNAAFKAEDMLKWAQKKVWEICLVAGQVGAGPDGSTQVDEERIRQTQAQEQLDREQRPKPGEGAAGDGGSSDGGSGDGG